MDLYNVKDKKYISYIKGLSLANKPIQFYTRQINHLKVDDVLSIGEEMYKKTMLPFMLSKDFIFSDQKPDLDMLDILTDNSFSQYHEDLVTAVGLVLNVDLTDIEIITIDDIHKEILIKDKKDIYNNFYMDSNKFEQLKSIVLFVNNLRELKQSDKSQDRLNSTDEYNKRLAVFYKGKEDHDKIKGEESNNEILNMFDFLVHIQGSLDYDKVLNLNMYQFYNSVKRYNQKEDCDFTRDLYSSGQIQLKGIEIPKFYKTITDDNK